MALIKTKMTELGVEATYWKINMISIDRLNGVGSISLALYLNKEQSKSNTTNFFEDKVYFINRSIYPDVFENMTNNVYNIAYNHIKEIDDYFKDAISDNEEVQQ